MYVLLVRAPPLVFVSRRQQTPGVPSCKLRNKDRTSDVLDYRSSLIGRATNLRVPPRALTGSKLIALVSCGCEWRLDGAQWVSVDRSGFHSPCIKYAGHIYFLGGFFSMVLPLKWRFSFFFVFLLFAAILFLYFLFLSRSYSRRLSRLYVTNLHRMQIRNISQ